MENIYDIAIIGGGPAGMTAGIYSSRAGMKALLIEKTACGGQILITDTIENYPGFPDGIKGPDLAEYMRAQAERFGLDTKETEAKNIILKKKEKEPFEIKLSEGESVLALSVIISTGARWNALGIPGEKELVGRGVSYCATCDGPLFKGRDLVVIGGGDSALEEGLFLTKFATKVTIVHRRGRLRAAKILQDRAVANKKISFSYNSMAIEIIGKNRVEGVRVKDVNTNDEKVLKCDGAFIFIGITPNSEIAKGLLKLDEKGYIVSDDDMRTSVDGIFVCGDARKKVLRQVVTATGEGAAAAVSAQHYVERLKGTEYPLAGK